MEGSKKYRGERTIKAARTLLFVFATSTSKMIYVTGRYLYTRIQHHNVAALLLDDLQLPFRLPLTLLKSIFMVFQPLPRDNWPQLSSVPA